MPAKDVSLRKRQQIAKANRTMFVWIAIASVIVGASAVISYALWQKLTFNEKILSVKSTTISNLEHNLSIVDELSNNIRVLNTNQKLINLADSDSEPLQVVFDALPSSPNSTALGSSLQSEKLLGKNGITLDSIEVTPIAGVEDSGDNSAGTSDDLTTLSDSDTPTIKFAFTVSTAKSGSEGAKTLQSLVQQLERSIRTINVTSARFENQSEKTTLTVSGVAYYQPAKTVSMKEEPVRP